MERILAELETTDDPAVSARVEELVRTLVEFYGACLSRIMEIVAASGDAAGLVRELGDDELVGGVLVVHDLHPLDTRERVSAALERVRPYLGSHSGDVDLLGVDDDGVVRLRLAGSCHGCPSSTVTVKLAIEQAIQKVAPEVTHIEVEGVAERPASATAPNGHPLLPLSPVGDGVGSNGAGRDGTAEPSAPMEVTWVDVNGFGDMRPGDVALARLGQADTLLCNVSGRLYAYRDRCPACAATVHGGRLEGELLRCPECGRRYDVTRAGRGSPEEDLHLDPFPLLRERGSVRVALPAEAVR